MSNSPHILKSNRWGKRMGNTTVEDMMLGALNCPFGTGHMELLQKMLLANMELEEKIKIVFL